MALITVTSQHKTTVLSVPEGTLLVDALSAAGFGVPAACGRRGTCGKCRVKLIGGAFDGEAPDENGFVRSCRAAVKGDAAVSLPFEGGTGLTEFGAARLLACGAGAAVDIGTTTVAAAAIKSDGSVVTCSRLNPQSAFGADVISRISACAKGSLGEQTRLIRECVNSMLAELFGDEVPGELVVSGNTVMLHIFCGVSPESMGVFPFTPAFTDAAFYDGAALGINAKKVTVLPVISAFAGGDTVAGIYALGLHRQGGRRLLADLGTNGELVLADGGRLFCASAAAGPALEGACIECGMGGVDGAISRVYDDGGEIAVETVGGAEPRGICGSGLADAAALMLKRGVIDETGYLEAERFYISGPVYLTPGDIRQLQLAKSAVRAGIETLAEAAGVPLASLDAIYIAGGLGYYLGSESAFEIGLLPRLEPEKVKSAGNTSLQGALMCVGCSEAVEEMRTIARECKTVDLGGNPAFSQRFADFMFFE